MYRYIRLYLYYVHMSEVITWRRLDTDIDDVCHVQEHDNCRWIYG